MSGGGWEAWVDNDNRIKCCKAISSLSFFPQFPFLLDPGPGVAAVVKGLRGSLSRQKGTRGTHKTRWRATLSPSGVSVMLIKQSDTTLGADWRAGPPVAVKVAWSVKQTLASRTRGDSGDTGEDCSVCDRSRQERVRGAESPSVRPPFPRPLRRGSYVLLVSMCLCSATVCSGGMTYHQWNPPERAFLLARLNCTQSIPSTTMTPLPGRPSDQCATPAYPRSIFPLIFLRALAAPEGRQVPASCFVHRACQSGR